ncbi:MAG: META domain-containing protein [Williamsia sp.]|nr:META domain-containing protein [Williamsia sp.]
MKTLGFLLLIVFSTPILAQQLQPGFDKGEETEMLRIANQTALEQENWSTALVPAPARFHMVYRSPVMGLGNRWDLWSDAGQVAVISIRGTTLEAVSWLVNFYQAMVPAKGQLRLSGTEVFPYELSSNPKAAVHTGFLIAMAFLSKDILTKIDSCYKAGVRDFIVTGHSQGGAISYLLTSYLHNQQRQGRLSSGIRFKTYCGASPKTGNLFYAYDYEAMTQNGWAFNVVNSADWVPEAGISIQTFNDFNTTNPFVNARKLIKKQKFPNNLVGRYVYNRLDKITLRAQRRFRRNMGNLTSRFVKSYLKGFEPPQYANTSNYVRAGTTIVLMADEAYYKSYPDDPAKIFIHHFPAPYLYLLDKLQLNGTSNQPMPPAPSLSGAWELNYISGRRIAFEGLYPNKKPFVQFDQDAGRVSGNTSCNSFAGPFKINGSSISFAEPLATTRMACPGEGEQAFLDMLKKVNGYAITDGKVLTFLIGDVAVMRFAKKEL